MTPEFQTEGDQKQVPSNWYWSHTHTSQKAGITAPQLPWHVSHHPSRPTATMPLARLTRLQGWQT